MALSNMSSLSFDLIQSQALQSAKVEAKSIREAHDFYTEEVTDRIKGIEGVKITPNYDTLEGAIPHPATYIIELGSRITKNHPGSLFRIYSDYPFPYRQEEGGVRDEFEQDALNYFRKNYQDAFVRVENFQGRSSLRYGEPIIMQASCVACHNNHPDSPKRDWKVGDVRGVFEITRPLDHFFEQTKNGLKGTFFMLGGFSVLGVFALTIVIARLRQTAKELEEKVRERTADLADLNSDLEKRNGLIRQVFGRYLSDEVVANLLRHPDNLKLGGDCRKITILTSDLRGFTALSEQIHPAKVIDIINIYFEEMADVIARYQGTIDKFMGDGILVLFGITTTKEDDSARAIACACAMQLAMTSVNEKMARLGFPKLEMGIGINTGEVVVGNIGSEKHTEYSVVGSPVNLTYRIESYTTGGQILISEQTLKDVGSIVKIGEQIQVKAKGVKQPIIVYEIEGISGSYNLYLPTEKEVFLPLVQAIPIQYTIVEEKQISTQVFEGCLVQLSAQGAKIRFPKPGQHPIPSPFTNIRLNLLGKCYGIRKISEDIYGKVLERKGDSPNCFYIHFTAIPPEIKLRLKNLYKSREQVTLQRRLYQRTTNC